MLVTSSDCSLFSNIRHITLLVSVIFKEMFIQIRLFTFLIVFRYPLINLPLPGDIPVQTITEGFNFTIPDNITVFSDKPYVYIQQIVLKTGVSPWLKDMTVHDAFRAPLHQVFPLLETIRNYQLENR